MIPALVAVLGALAVALVAVALRRRRRWQESAVMFFLAAKRGPVPSLEVFSALGGFWVYAVLRRLEREGSLRSWEAPGTPERGRPRRLYALASWQGDVAFVPTDRPLSEGEPVYIAPPRSLQ